MLQFCLIFVSEQGSEEKLQWKVKERTCGILLSVVTTDFNFYNILSKKKKLMDTNN